MVNNLNCTKNLISIIVPIYNVARYLPRCIESVIGQSYKNWELVLVDDGSTDNSGSICDKYVKKDNRIKVVHKQNGGVAVARNVGISQSQGEYIIFVDSDDWISCDCLKILIESMDYGKYDLSIAKTKAITCVRDVQHHVISNNFLEYDFKNIDSVTSFFSEENNWRGPCAKIYKSDIIKNNNLLFPAGVSLGEDTIFVLDYLKHCSIVIQCNKHLYYYNRLVNSSAVTKYHVDYPSYARIMILKQMEIYNSINYNNTKSFDKQLRHEIYNTILFCMCMSARSKDMYVFKEATANIVVFVKKIGFPIESLFETMKENEDDKEQIMIFNYLVNSDYNSLFNYYTKIHKDNIVKRFIKSVGKMIRRFIIFDLKIGYWK